MESWQSDLLKICVTGAISGIGGWWAHWKWMREEQKKADLREQDRLSAHDQRLKDFELEEQQRQAEYAEFKKKRRLVGEKEDERLQRVQTLTALIVQHREHKITPEDFEAYKQQFLGGRKLKKKPDNETREVLPIESEKVPDEYAGDRDFLRPVKEVVRTPDEIREALAKMTDASFYWMLRMMLDSHDKGIECLEDDQYTEFLTLAREIEQRQKRMTLGTGSEWDRGVIEGEFALLMWLTNRSWSITQRTHLSEKWREYTPGVAPPGFIRQHALLDDRPDDPKPPLRDNRCQK